MGAEARVVRRMASGLVVLKYDARFGYEGTDVWSKCKLRKPAKCSVSGIEMQPGDEAYRPVGNQQYRADRIHPMIVEGTDGA